MNDDGTARASGLPVTVRVISPYPSVRAGLRVLLGDDPRLHVVGDGGGWSGEGGEPLGRPEVDVLVVDLPSSEAMDDLLDEADRLPSAGVVLLGAPPYDHYDLVRLGPRPWGLLPREADAEELAVAVQTVHAGLLAIDPAIAAQLFTAVSVPRPAPVLEEGGEELTPREVEVLSLISEGIPNKAIARRLGISEHTVKFHVGSVLGKLGAASRTEAVRVGARRGLIAL